MPSDNRRIMMVVTALVAVGATLRLQMYLFDKPLWWPEAALALNILRRSGWALLGPYDFHQAAPIGFVLITKAGTLLFGDSERVLRLPAFLFGLASLPLFYMAARAYISQAAALLALAFFALSPSAIYWASNCKQVQLRPDVCDRHVDAGQLAHAKPADTASSVGRGTVWGGWVVLFVPTRVPVDGSRRRARV